jgi:hypothetical protein
MPALYVLRVIFISVEAIALGGALLVWTYFRVELQTIADSIVLNGELLKYLTLLPVLLSGWIILETRSLLQQDGETVSILIDWPDYWKLKIHTWISLVYSLLFAFMSLIPWISNTGITSDAGMLLFITAIVGQLSLAGSVFSARIRVQELIAHAKSVKRTT